MKGGTMRIGGVLTVLLVWGMVSCERAPASYREGKEPLSDFLVREMKSYYDLGRRPCPGCSPSYYLDVMQGLELHRKGKWGDSNKVLLKAYREEADQATAVSYFIALNHGMLGAFPESRQWGERAVSLHLPASWGKAALADPLYGDLFRKPPMRWLPLFVEDQAKVP
jgi:hypothetical protein